MELISCNWMSWLCSPQFQMGQKSAPSFCWNFYILVDLLMSQVLTEMFISSSVQICGEEVLPPYNSSRVFPQFKSLDIWIPGPMLQLDIDLTSVHAYQQLVGSKQWIFFFFFFSSASLYNVFFFLISLLMQYVSIFVHTVGGSADSTVSVKCKLQMLYNNKPSFLPSAFSVYPSVRSA